MTGTTDLKINYNKDGKLHRDDDKPAVINGYHKKWYKNGVQYK